MFLSALTLALALTAQPAQAYSDDPADWAVDPSIEYKPVISDPLWLAPAMASNNNVAIEFHGDRLFVAWRSAPIHFASTKAKLLIVSSADGGRSWQPDHEI